MKPTIATAIWLMGSALLAPRLCVAQFYPDSNAVWCITHYTNPPYDVQYQMGNDPDTLIMDQVYKRITATSNETGVWENIKSYYVRSDPFGRGFTMLLDEMEECLTGDQPPQSWKFPSEIAPLRGCTYCKFCSRMAQFTTQRSFYNHE